MAVMAASMDPEAIWLEAVRTSVLLRHLAPHEVKSMRVACKVSKVRAQMNIYRQGAFADCFYVVQSGRFRASVGSEDATAREYGQCQTFGSYEILFPQPRTASLTCVESGALWMIEKKTFVSKLAGDAVASGMPAPSTIDFVRSVHLFADLDDGHVVQLARAANEQTLAPDEKICSQGDKATAIYAVMSGSIVTSQSDSSYQYTMRAPDFMGESALYPEEELRIRKATVSAGKEGAVVVSFEVLDIEAVIGFALQEQAVRTYNRKLLCSVRFEDRAITEGLDPKQVDWLVDSLKEEQYNEGFIIAPEGEIDQTLYILKRGRASVYKSNVGEVAQLAAGDFFGEMSLVERKQRRSASIVARGNPALTLLELPASLAIHHPGLHEWRRELMRVSGLLDVPFADATNAARRASVPKRRLSFAERIAETQAIAYRAAAVARKERAKAARKQHEHDMAVLEGKIQLVLRPGPTQANPSSPPSPGKASSAKRPNGSADPTPSDASLAPQLTRRIKVSGKGKKQAAASTKPPSSTVIATAATTSSKPAATATVVMASKDVPIGAPTVVATKLPARTANGDAGRATTVRTIMSTRTSRPSGKLGATGGASSHRSAGASSHRSGGASSHRAPHVSTKH